MELGMATAPVGSSAQNVVCIRDPGVASVIIGGVQRRVSRSLHSHEDIVVRLRENVLGYVVGTDSWKMSSF
jgi:hypothetical protein